MPAPLVVAHLEVGLALEQLGAGLDDTQRAGVYLTNALTGWEPQTTKPLPFPRAGTGAQGRDQGQAAAQDPGRAGQSALQRLPRRIRQCRGAQVDGRLPRGERREMCPNRRARGLNDLYVRFYRMAERRIAEKTGEGVVCFISNYSWLDGLSFPGMRQRYLDAFDIVRIDNLNGDRYRTGKVTPDGDSDPSVFSTPDDPVGIQVGTAIAMLVRKQEHMGAGHVDYRELWGTTKLAALDSHANEPPQSLFETHAPDWSVRSPLWAKEGSHRLAKLAQPVPTCFPPTFQA